MGLTFHFFPLPRCDAKAPVETHGVRLRKEWEVGCYRLLLNNKDKLYLFYPAGVNDKIPVDVIPMSRVKAFRILPTPETCGD